MDLSFNVCSAYYVVGQEIAQNSCIVDFCESKLGEMMRDLYKKREGMVPERGWLGLGKEIFRVVSVRRDQSGCGLGGRRMGKKWDFKKHSLK